MAEAAERVTARPKRHEVSVDRPAPGQGRLSEGGQIQAPRQAIQLYGSGPGTRPEGNQKD